MIRNDAAKVYALVDCDIVIGAGLNSRNLLVLQHYQQRIELLRRKFSRVIVRHLIEGNVVIFAQKSLNGRCFYYAKFLSKPT